MNIYKLKFTKLQNEIFRLLCVKPGEKMSQRQISKFLNVSPTAISKSIIELKEENLIKIEKDKNLKITYVELNRDSERTISFKRAENLKMIYESGLDTCLGDTFPGSVIILFGSYSYGEDTTRSDIDIAIIGAKRKDIDLERFEKLLEKEININFYDNLKEIHKNLKNNILNGILLSGSVSL